MRTRKVIAALMAALALSGVATTVQPQSVNSTVEARTKRSGHKRKSARKSRRSRRRVNRKRNNRRRTNKKHVNRKRVNKKKPSRKRPTKRVNKKNNRHVVKTANWWDNLPNINFDTHAPLETQMERALELQGRERDAADYAIMREEGLLENGQPTVSRASLERQMRSMIQDQQHMRNEILNINQMMKS